MIQEIQDTLIKYWGFDQLRPLQSEIIQSVLKKKDTLAVLSTGAGKSLCYQLPALLLPGVCLVVSPLIALMEDQLLELKTKGIKAMGLYGPMSEESLIQRLDNISYGNYKIVFIAPERLQNPIVNERLAQIELSFLAVDEAHCISKWGHDYRPSYRSIGTFRAQMDKLPILALTATATPKVIEDIHMNLLLDDVQEFIGPVARSALTIQRHYHVDKDLLLNIALKRNLQKCILIYVRSRSKAEKLSQQLKTEGYDCSYYHAGLSPEEKSKRLKYFTTAAHPIMVCTSAFGMGIDRQDVRLVVHYDIPESLEQYYQEIGRAGRDQKSATAVLISEEERISKFTETALALHPTVDQLYEIYKKLVGLFQIASGELPDQTYSLGLAESARKAGIKPREWYLGIRSLEKYGILQFGETNRKEWFITFEPSRFGSLDQADDDLLFRKLSQKFHESKSSTFRYRFSSSKMLRAAESAAKRAKIKLDSTTDIYTIHWTVPREDQLVKKLLRTHHQPYMELRQEHANKMQEFLENQSQCAMQLIAEHFGQQSEECGICDVCTRSSLKHEDLLRFCSTPRSFSDFISIFECSPQDIRSHLSELESEGLIGVTNEAKFYSR